MTSTDYDAEVPSGLTCYDCGRQLASTVRNGWATMIHQDHTADHPIRYRVTAKSWVTAHAA